MSLSTIEGAIGIITPTMHPHILFVPGSFSPATIYAPFISLLQNTSVPASAVDLPSVIAPGAALPSKPASLYDDAAAIHAALTPLLDAHKEIVLLAHSYGGLPASQVFQYPRISLKERRHAGLGGGISKIIYVSSPLPELDHSSNYPVAVPNSYTTQMPGTSFITLDADGYLTISNQELAAKAIYSDMPLEEGLEQVKTLGRQSPTAFADNVTVAGWTRAPVAFSAGDEDMVVPYGRQQQIIGYLALQSGGVQARQWHGGHAPMFARPEAFVEEIKALI